MVIEFPGAMPLKGVGHLDAGVRQNGQAGQDNSPNIIYLSSGY
jgi:hypothetical protein